MSAFAPPVLSRLAVADPPGRWEALGFHVRDRAVRFDGVALALGAPGRGIVGWTLSGTEPVDTVDGLRTEVAALGLPGPAPQHPNGAVGIDHVVVITPDFERTSDALAQAGLPLRRIRHVEARGGVRQGFRRLGPAILEIVETPEMPEGPARFWGLVLVVADLPGLAERLGDRLGRVKPAVQPGRHIATLRSGAGLTPAVAFIDVEPPVATA